MIRLVRFIYIFFRLYFHIYISHKQSMIYLAEDPILTDHITEIFLLVQQSLRNKVSSLDEDAWMYEVEDEIHV